jgi:uncharacterized protein (DUF305 family)
MKTSRPRILWMPLVVLAMTLAIMMTQSASHVVDAMDHGHEHYVGSELEFLVKMIPHHQEAVDSASHLRAVTVRPKMRDFATAVVDVQAKEIARMRKWIERWYPGQSMQPAYQPMMRDLKGLSAAQADVVFLEDMIKHHVAAVHMARELLDKNLAKHEEVRALAQEIITTQSREIEQMSGWLQTWGNESVPAGQHSH